MMAQTAVLAPMQLHPWVCIWTVEGGWGKLCPKSDASWQWDNSCPV